MDAFTRTMDHISFNPDLKVELTPETAAELLQKAVKHLELQDMSPKRDKDKNYGNSKYFVYIGCFPKLHLAIDNASGTSRKYSLTTEEELLKVPK